MPVSTKTLSWVYFFTLSLIWGSAFYLIEIGNETFTALQVGCLRIFIGFIFLLFLILKFLRTIPRKKLLLVLVTGIVGSLIPAILFALSEKTISGSTAGILSALTPMFTFLTSIFFFREKAKPNQFFGVIVGFIGAIVLSIFNGSGKLDFTNPAGLYVLIATICYGVNLNILKYKLKDIPSLAIASCSLLFVGPLSLIILLSTDFIDQIHTNPHATHSLLAISILGITSTGIAIILFNKMLKISTAIFSSSVTYAIPIIAIIIGYFIAGNSIGYVHILGTGIIFLGIIILRK